MPRRMIVLTGRKRTGKGTFFLVTRNDCKGSVSEFFFAKPIKDFCINALGLTQDQMYGATEQRESPTLYKWGNVAKHIRERWKKSPDEFLTARQVLQVVGTDVMRDHFDPDVWARAGALEAVRSNADICIFTDGRMENEIDTASDVALRSNFEKPIVVRLYRESGLEDEHITERALDKYDAIPNQRNLADGIPRGFEQLSTRLFRNKTPGNNPFDFLIDNNGTVEEMQDNVKKLLSLTGFTA